MHLFQETLALLIGSTGELYIIEINGMSGDTKYCEIGTHIKGKENKPQPSNFVLIELPFAER